MKYAILTLMLIVMWGFSDSAFADETELRGETFCFPAKGVPKLVSELAKVKAKRRNIIDVELEPKFIIKDGGVWPDKFYLAKDGTLVQELPFSRITGSVPSFIQAASTYPETDICVDDPTRAARPITDEGLYFEMGLSPLFKFTSGKHDIADLTQAARDGKSFYKKMLPDVLSIFMPDTNYFAIKMEDRSTHPKAYARSGNIDKELPMEAFKDMWIVSLADINSFNAMSLIIRGGRYDLQPVPSPRVLRKFGIGDAVHEN